MKFPEQKSSAFQVYKLIVSVRAILKKVRFKTVNSIFVSDGYGVS